MVICCLVIIMFLAMLRPCEYQMLRLEDVISTIVTPAQAKKLKIEPYVCVPLVRPTKTSRTGPAGALIAWHTANGMPFGRYMMRLIRLHRRLGRSSGPLFTDVNGAPLKQTAVIQEFLRPSLHRLQSEGYVHATVVIDDVNMNTFRRGGLTHGRDRLLTKDHTMLLDGHARWRVEVDGRGHLPMPDRYDGLSSARKLIVTKHMW